MKIDEHESWHNSVEKKIDMVEDVIQFPTQKSEWYSGKKEKKPIARNGATLFPHALVVVTNEEKSEKHGHVFVTMKKSRHGVWKEMGVLEMDVVNEWIKECLFSENLSAYCCPTTTRVVIPIDDNGDWLDERMSDPFWLEVSNLYSKEPKSGTSTPKTIEKNLDFSSKLSKQFKIKEKHLVVYNKSGNRVYASVVGTNNIIENGLYYVKCRSQDEAYFLSAVLNSNVIQMALVKAKEASRHHDTHFWKKVPIPRYNKKNPTHVKISKHAKMAEDTAHKSFKPGMGTQKMRKAALAAVSDTESGRLIDAGVKEIMPQHCWDESDSTIRDNFV